MIFAAMSNSRSDVVTQCVSSSVRPSVPLFVSVLGVSPSPKEFQCCIKEVLRMLQGRFKGVPGDQWSFKGT